MRRALFYLCLLVITTLLTGCGSKGLGVTSSDIEKIVQTQGFTISNKDVSSKSTKYLLNGPSTTIMETKGDTQVAYIFFLSPPDRGFGLLVDAVLKKAVKNWTDYDTKEFFRNVTQFADDSKAGAVVRKNGVVVIGQVKTPLGVAVSIGYEGQKDIAKKAEEIEAYLTSHPMPPEKNAMAASPPQSQGPMMVSISSVSDIKGYKTYKNGRYGFSIDHPANFVSGKAPANGDGLRFTSPDGRTELTVSGGNNAGTTLKQYFAMTPEGPVAYSETGDNWFVASWEKDGMISYCKMFVGTQSHNSFIITYPKEQMQQYEGIVSTLEKTFRPGAINIGH